MENILEKDEIYGMASYADNAQDGIIMALLFEQMTLEEISGLKIKDVESGKVKLGESQQLLNRAIEDPIYILIEGENSKNITLASTEFVIRGEKEGKVEVEELVKRVRKTLDNFAYNYISVDDIRLSGQQQQQ